MAIEKTSNLFFFSTHRDGTSVKVTPSGLEKLPGIFISRLVPGGLAESTGLLAVNDEVIEVNGIEVAGKTLDQVMYLPLVFILICLQLWIIFEFQFSGN